MLKSNEYAAKNKIFALAATALLSLALLSAICGAFFERFSMTYHRSKEDFIALTSNAEQARQFRFFFSSFQTAAHSL